MSVKLKLKNSKETALVDDKVAKFLNENPYLVKVGFLANLRRHSRGYAFFQKNWPLGDGTYKNETIYLHKLVAEIFCKKKATKERLFVNVINNNPLDCRLENLEFAPRSVVVRNVNKTENKFGYKGVIKSGNKFKAILFNNRVRLDLGTFHTAAEASAAYKKKTAELFGKGKK